jgi:DNA/RNA endonuclease G (NUC1)
MNARRTSVFILTLLVSLLVAQAALAVSSGVVISQVYGGAGCTSANCAAYGNDYIELFNRGTSPVSLNGWSVQYASATGTSWAVTPLTSVTLQPGQYYLVSESAGSAGTFTNPIPTADKVGTIAMSATAAKVALVSSTTALVGGCPSGMVDLVGYGSTASCSETAFAPAPSTANAIFRAAAGCTDTDNNGADFAAAAATPRNTTTATHSCVVANNPPTITAPANPIASILQNAAPFTVSLTGSDDNSVYNWSATAGTGVQNVSVSGGQGTATATFTVTLVNNFSGTASFTASLSDNVNSPATTRLVNITVNAAPTNNPPTINAPANPITSVEQNAPAFTVNLTGNDDNAVYNWSATTGTGVANVSVSNATSATATFTVTLSAGFSGTATFTGSLSDNVNTPAAQPVNITVNPLPPPPNHVVISQLYGGGGNSGATYQNDFVELFNPTNATVNMTGWAVEYQSATGTGNWSGLQPIGGNIGPGEYFLIQLASGGAAGSPLPTPNIDGGSAAINMSGTAGKVALVNAGDLLAGCPTASAAVIDLVGYGTTANCREGSSNAPAPSNTTALFRRNGGSYDTNVNGTDFTVATPSPRRTSPIQEIGPFVVTVDPSSGASIAPHDASITVTFSEPVFTDSGWFDITCATTGAHNSATQASSSNGSVWVITPNVSFAGGEQCTVTIYKDLVHDVDTDDSNAGTDTLPANKVWSFTTSTGQPAPYTPDVHLTMGNPSNAAADILQPNNYLMVKPTYALSYNRDKGTSNWVSWHLETAWYGSLLRVDTFRPDPLVPAAWYRVQATDYFASGFDRGHMTPNADRDNENRIPINQETYLMSNMVPQAPDNNQGPWANLENYLRSLTDAGSEIYIVSGPAGVGGSGSNGGTTMTIAGGHVTVPAYTWKAALVLPKATGDDVARVSASTRTIAVIMPNTQGIRTNNSNDWQAYLTSVDQVEALTGYNLFSNVPEAIQNAIEAGVNGVNPPGAANVSLSTNEDNAKSVTFDVANPGASALTYTIVAPPSHGSLTGSGSNQTYTPAPDYNGSDSFTYNVNDGTRTSNTATVTVSVLEVNDPPVAADDAKSTNEDTPLVFAASDLTANDAAGPANESGQTLTVTSVSGTANTHGSVSLSAGQITYSPDADYNGAASFTYQVCDNGVTAGLTNSLCTTGTVFVTIAEANDQPLAADDAKSTNEDAPLVFAASDLTANDAAGPANESSQTLTVTSVTATAASHGTVSLSGGQITYSPEANYTGAATFTYQVCDNGTSAGAADSKCATATVHVTIAETNDPPAAADDAKSATEDTPLVFAASDLTANDNPGPANESGQTLTVTSVSATASTHGSVSLNAGQITYSPEANYNGAASFTYQVCDNGTTAGAADSLCTTGTVFVTIAEVNDPPVAADDAKSTSEDTPLVFAASDLSANDNAGPANESSQTLTVTSVSATASTHGSVSLSAGQITYSPEANYNGAASFTYQICDNGTTAGAADSLCTTGTVFVTIAEVNDPPVAADDAKSTSEDTPLVFAASDVTANDHAGPATESSQTLTVTSVSGTASTHGSVSLNAGQITYSPEANYNGAATFTYQICDNGTTAGAADSLCTTATVFVTIAETNDPPAAADDTKTATEDTPLVFAASDLTANDHAGPATESSQTLTVTSVSATASTHGSVSLNAGQITYSPEANYNGAATFTYQVCDNGTTAGAADSLCTTATVFVTVTPVNDPPVASLTAPSGGAEGSAINTSGSATDVDDTDLTFAWSVTKNGSAYATGSGASFSFTPDDNGTYAVTLVVSDPHGGTDTKSASIDVTNVAPVIGSVSGPSSAIANGTAATVALTYSDAGSADTHTATYTWDDGSSATTVACAGGNCSASHTFPRAGTYRVDMTLTDDDGGTASASFAYVVVYDPLAGFMTGSGWINSTTGKATFSFNAKYAKGSTTPAGSTDFVFGTSELVSTSYDSLVVAGNKAQIRGHGTINGSGNYAFVITGVDNHTGKGKPTAADQFRIHITDGSGVTIFDNAAGASDDIDAANAPPVGAGNINIAK